MSTTDIRRSTVATLDIPLGPGRQTYRAALARDADGEPLLLTLARGWGEDDAWNLCTSPDNRLSVPGDAVRPLIEAMQALEAADDSR